MMIMEMPINGLDRPQYRGLFYFIILENIQHSLYNKYMNICSYLVKGGYLQ